MKKGIALSLVFALLVGVMLCVPTRSSEALGMLSEGQQPDELLTESFEALRTLKSGHVDADLTLDMNMIISFGGQNMSMPISILLKTALDEQTEPLCLQGQMDLDMSSMGASQTKSYLFYFEKEDNVFAAYSSEDNGASWKVTKSEAKAAQKIDIANVASLIATNIKEFENTGTELVDGVEAQVYSGKLDTGFLQQAMEKAGAADSLDKVTDELGIEGGLSALGDIGFAMYIDANTHLPLKFTMDMSDLLKNVVGAVLKTAMGMDDMDGYEMDVEITSALLECRLKDINALPALEVPVEVKTVAVETEAKVPSLS